MIHRDTRTPWGKVQEVEYITPWLTRVHTAGHGGYKVDRTHNGAIPEYIRRKGGWYEEDCEWTIVFVTLENLIRKDAFDFSRKDFERIIESRAHIDTFKDWYPTEYEMFFNVVLREGESRKKDEIQWKDTNRGKWHVVSAITLFDGWCKLTLCLNGEREHINTNFERNLIVKNEEYTLGNLRSKFGTAITMEQINYYEDIANHQRNCVTV
jgi:hypothetical protein